MPSAASPQRSTPISRLLRLVAVAAIAVPGAAYGAGAVTHPAAHAAALPPVSAAARAQALHALAGAPMHFEQNVGQSAAGVRFLARGMGYGLFLSGGEATLVLRQGRHTLGRAALGRHPVAQLPASVLHMQLLGGNQKAQATGIGRLSGVANYLIGKQPSGWHRGVATYARVRFHDVYSGVDLLYYGNGSHLEYDFIVAPGADARQVQLRFAGAQHLGLDRQGNLVVRLRGGSLIQRAPIVYQQGLHGRVRVAGHFVLRGDTVRFALGAYDHRRALVIDPTLLYSTYLGGSDDDYVLGMALDGTGNVYLTGQTLSTDFPTKTPEQPTNAGFADAFVVKLHPGGNGAADLIYATYLGGSGDDTGYGIAVDSAGNAYVGGESCSIDFPIMHNLPASGTQNSADNCDAFVSKLNPTGTTLLYSTLLGGSGTDIAYALAIDGSGNAYITGSTESHDLPTTAGAYQVAAAAEEVVFVAKLNTTYSGVPSLASLVYSTYVGGVTNIDGSASDGNAILVDSAGAAYITGADKDPNFPTTPGAYQRTFASAGCVESNTCGGADVFVTKLNAAGSGLVFSTLLGGSDNDEGNGLALDSQGNIYVAGETESFNYPVTQGALQRVNHSPPGDISNFGTSTGFVSKLTGDGSKLVYSTYLGGSSGGDFLWSLAVDGTGAAYVAGETSSTDFPVTPTALYHTLQGGADIFVSKLTPSGMGLIYSTYLGGSNDDGTVNGQFGIGVPIAVDSLGQIYVAGATLSPNYPTTPGAYNTQFNLGTSSGFADGVLSILGVSGCAVSGVFQSGNQRVGVASLGTAGSTTIGYITAQLGAINFIVTFPQVSCQVGVPATFTLKGVARSGKGGVLAGDLVTATVTFPAVGSPTVTVSVMRGATVVVPPTTVAVGPYANHLIAYTTY